MLDPGIPFWVFFWIPADGRYEIPEHVLAASCDTLTLVVRTEDGTVFLASDGAVVGTDDGILVTDDGTDPANLHRKKNPAAATRRSRNGHVQSKEAPVILAPVLV